MHEALLFFFQDKAGQAASGIGGSVNSDAIGTNFWGDCRCVTVHDDFSMLRLTGEERFAITQEIITMTQAK